jgi:hypothetical protein
MSLHSFRRSIGSDVDRSGPATGIIRVAERRAFRGAEQRRLDARISPTTTVGRLNRKNFRPCSSSSSISLAASPSFPNEGFWAMAGITYRNAMVLYHMLTSDAQEAR